MELFYIILGGVLATLSSLVANREDRKASRLAKDQALIRDIWQALVKLKRNFEWSAGLESAQDDGIATHTDFLRENKQDRITLSNQIEDMCQQIVSKKFLEASVETAIFVRNIDVLQSNYLKSSLEKTEKLDDILSRLRHLMNPDFSSLYDAELERARNEGNSH